MVRDFKFNRQNAEKNEMVEEAENIPANSNDSSSNQPSCGNADGFRVPLNSIPVPEQTVNSKADSDREAFNKSSRFNRTPTKVKGKTVAPPALPLRTPDKAGNAAKSRFGWSTMFEGRSDMANYLSQSGKYAGVGAGSLNLTPRVNRATNGGGTSSGFSEASSTQTTPTKSVSKPPNPGFGSTSVSRCTGHGSVRAGGYAALSRGSPAHSTASAVVNTVEVPHFDLKEDPSFWMDHNIQVIIRVRPLNSMERSTQGYNRCVRQESGQTITWTGQPETRFTFDHVACETVDQEMLFRMAGLPMVENCLSGYNSCMFAYGQTGSGKTYTMLGEIEDLEFKPSLDRGMTPRIFEFLFARIRAEEESRRDEKLKYSCKCSFLEIYNEQITDLLDPSSTNLLLREDVRKGVYVENLSEVEVQTVGDIVKLLAQGSSNRKVAATNMNRESSRSHSVFTCVIESKWDRDSSTNLRFARLNLVDLAGSERQKTSGAEGGRLKEAANINKSLSTLGHVIMVLVDIAQGKPKHVPYRDSRLTFLLQDSLGGNSKTMIIANISPSICCAAETLNTLKFAQRAKCIQNNAVVNEDSSGDVSALQHQIRVLKEELSAIKRQNVSRPLLFVPASLTNPGTVPEGGETETQELDVSKGDAMLGCEPRGGVTVSSKQLKAMETILAGALRREQMAEASIKQLEAEREQLNRLVHQREEDSQCTKMMLKFREDKIHRMESFLSGLKPVDSYLLEENTTLSEQIRLLRMKLDKNPEVTRFAMENIRLLEQLRRFQDFYEEGEREILLKEVSELRDQLFELLDGNAKLQIPPREATNSKDDTLHLELKKAHNDLQECQSKLKYCLESNTKLSREIVDLQALLNKKSATCDSYKNVGVIKESIIEVPVQSTQSLPTVQNEKHGTVLEDTAKHAEEMVNMQLELDILKIILKEESFSRGKLEEITFCLKHDLILAEESIFFMNKQYDTVKEELQESKLVIEALESQHLMLIKEIDDLRTNNLQKSELSRKQELVIFNSEEQISGLNCNESNDQLATKLSRHEDSFLQEKLSKMQASLDIAKRLNELYHDDHAFNQSSEKEIEEVRRQAEAETAEVIVCLQEELSTLQLQVQNSLWRESETKSKLVLLETQMRELQDALESMSQDNEALHEQLGEKGREMKQMLEDWEQLGNEIESVLTNGNETLIDTSDQLDSISVSVTRSSRWISEQVGKVMRQVSEKEFLIKKLQKYLEIAENKRNDVECMLRSLKGAALVITELHQQECYAKERDILKLRSELSAKISTIVELENRIKLGHKQMRKTSSCATVAFLLVNRLSEMNSSNQEALRLMGNQLTESVESSRRKDNILCQQNLKLEEIEKEIQGLKGEFKLVNDSSEMLRCQLEDWENCVSVMQKRLQANEVSGIQQTKEKLYELKTGVSRVQSRVIEYVEQAGNLCQKSHYKLCYLEDDCSSKSQDNGQADQKDEEACWHSVQNINNDNFECLVKKSENVSMESKLYDGRQDLSIIFLRKEIESALESLKGMEANISRLHAEKEGIRMSERQGCHGLKVLRDEVLKLQVLFNDFEEQCKHRLQPMHEKVLKVEKSAQETESIWHQRRELFESQLDDAKMVAAQKTSETCCLLARFEEAQDMMKEADVMINGLMIANETLKLQIKDLKSNEIVVTRERDGLAQEIQSMCCSNESKIQQYEHLEEQWESDLKNIGSIIQELEVFVAQTKMSSEEEFIDLVADLQSIKFKVCSKTNSVKSWLEDVWSEIIVKDTALSVLQLCHMGVLLEAVSGLNAENGILIHGLSESTSLIFNLREHNMKSKQELEMCEMFKWKLLADIENSFDRLLRKKDETWKLGMKLSSFEQKLSDLQLKVELMFERSNYITDELANLMNELNSSHSNVLKTLLEQEELLRESEKIIKTQDENYMIGLCAKELELFIMSSEMKQLAIQRAAMECKERNYHTILDYMKEKIVTLALNVDFKEQLLFEMGNEITVLQKEVEEVHRPLTKHSESVSELSHLNDFLKQDLENLNEKLKGELHEAREDKVTLVSQIDELQAQSEHLSMNLLLKEKECEHLCSRLLILDEENLKLHNDISFQVSSSEKLQNEMLVKNARLSKSSCLEEENEMLRKEMQELGVENMKLARDLEDKESEVISSASRIELLNSKTSSLQEMVQSLESRVNVLQEDIKLKKAELNNLRCSRFTIKDELHGKSQELQRCFSKMNALQEENICLRNELRSFECKAFSLSCISAASCVSAIEAAHIRTHKNFELLDEKIVLLLDHITDDACQHQEALTRFIDRLEFLDCLTQEMISENLSFQAELTRKDEVLTGLLFDLSLLQEFASNSKVQEDDIEELLTSLKFKEDALAQKSHELDEAASHIKALEAQLQGKVDIICSLEMNLLRKSHLVDEISNENKELQFHIQEILGEKTSVEEELSEKRKVCGFFKVELSEMEKTICKMRTMHESLKCNLDEAISEKAYLQKDLRILEGKLEAAEALAEEHEKIAAEAQQVAESRRVYGEEKEEEVMLLENSVQELDSTINVLENKVDMLQGEAERQRLQREELELELQSLEHQLHGVKSADVDIERHLDEKERNHQEALKRIQCLEKDLAIKESEIVQCKQHISELNLHAEVQASEYKKKFKTLEIMAEQVKPESHSSHGRNSPAGKLEKNASKGRGSGSPFKCIGLGLTQQLKYEKDKEITAEKVHIEELEALAVSRQKEIFMLNARLASAESMTHDVIRDLLGVKLDMNNYASLLNNEQLQKISDKVQHGGTMSSVKDEEVKRLKHQLNDFIEERQGWLLEIDRKQAELVAAQLALAKLRQRDQLLATENDILKMEISNHKKKAAELELEVRQLSDQQNLQQRIHHHAKIKEENNVLRVQNEDLSARLRRAETILSRVREELARYRASSGRSTFINFDEEKRLSDKLKETEEERLHLAQKLVGLCTSILKAAGITKPVAQINLSAALEAVEQLRNRITSLERELDDMKTKNKITTERIRLSELIPQASPLSATTEGNCRTPGRGIQSPYFSTLDR